MKKSATKLSVVGRRTPPAGSALTFKMEAGGKTYEGTVTVVEDGSDGPVTLPMLVNTLMLNIAKDCPELHDVQRIKFTARISKPNAKVRHGAKDADPN